MGWTAVSVLAANLESVLNAWVLLFGCNDIQKPYDALE